MSFQSPFDQPEYRAAKKKVAKKTPARKAAKKAPARKKVAKKKVAKKVRAWARIHEPGEFDTPKEWQGVPKDLRGMAALLNELYFSRLSAFGKKPVVIEDLKWGAVAISKHGSCRYYSGGPRDGQVRIIINGQLRPASVPTMVTAFTLFHEMVHAYCFKTGRKICSKHNSEFRKRERLFKGWEEVKAWRGKGGLYADSGEDCSPFKLGQKVIGPSGAKFKVTGCARGWIMITGSKGGTYRARRQHLVAANPGYAPILPELEGDAEVVVWKNPAPGSILPELEDDLEVVEWKP